MPHPSAPPLRLGFIEFFGDLLKSSTKTSTTDAALAVDTKGRGWCRILPPTATTGAGKPELTHSTLVDFDQVLASDQAMGESDEQLKPGKGKLQRAVDTLIGRIGVATKTSDTDGQKL